MNANLDCFSPFVVFGIETHSLRAECPIWLIDAKRYSTHVVITIIITDFKLI